MGISLMDMCFILKNMSRVERHVIIVLKPGSARRVDPGLEPGQVEEKIWEGITRCDPARLGQKPGCNRLTFVFFTKTTSFWFKKIDPSDPVTRSKPGTRALDRAGSENYAYNSGVCVKGSTSNEFEVDYYGKLEKVIEL
jgi:hypothetical protein